MCLQFGFVFFWQKDFGAKAAHKMLVKLTPDWVIFRQFGLLLRFQKWFVVYVLGFQIELCFRYFWPLLGNFLGDFLKKFGDFFLIFWSPWCCQHFGLLLAKMSSLGPLL
jgi:hypothetical protein